VLGSERIESLGMSLLPPWQNSLPGVVREQMKRTSLS
jgi:hypothetical protein